MLNPLPVVAADLRRSPAGFLAVVALIAVAVALGVSVSTLERALRRGSARAADSFDLLVGAPGSPTQLVLSSIYLQPAALPLVPGAVLQQLQREPGAAYAAPIAFGDRWRGYPVVGTTAPLVSPTTAGKLVEGRCFTAPWEAVAGADVPLAVGNRFAPSHGASVHRPAGEPEPDDDHHSARYEVVGRRPREGTPWDRAVLVPVESVWRLHGLPSGHPEDATRVGAPWEGAMAGVPAIAVKPRSVADAYRLRGKYRKNGTTALFPAEVLVELYARLGDARDLLAAVAVATQVLVVAAVLLAVFAALALRRRELAVLRALGASRAYVFAAVWTGVTLLVCAGSATGLALGWLSAKALGAALAVRVGFDLPVSLSAREAALVAALAGVGMVLALIPSVTGYRKSVASALKS